MARPRKSEAHHEAAGTYRSHAGRRLRQFEKPELSGDEIARELIYHSGWNAGYWFANWEPRFRKLWPELGAEVVAYCAENSPGERPWAWWRIVAPETRIRLGGRGVLLRDLGALWAVKPDWCGYPTKWSARDFGTGKAVPCFESSAAYLRRLGLLLPGEARRIKRVDFETANYLPRELWPHRGLGGAGIRG